MADPTPPTANSSPQLESGAYEVIRQRLNKHRPETLGLASHISGITPATISLLLVHLKKNLWKGTVPQATETEASA